jgi:anti-sigma B factor antagonist
MPSRSQRPGLEVEQVGAVAVVKITRSELLEEHTIAALGNQLYGLVEDAGCCGLVLNLERVRRLSSATVSKLVGLHQRLEAAGGRLAVCNLAADVAELFAALQLGRVFGIFAREQDALQSLQ